ncbi:MAG: adenylyl-sulfate kinase [Phycisphaerales bacterium]|nr:adenylyl-sulfate kinase [Phycisphaerales bacterium]
MGAHDGVRGRRIGAGFDGGARRRECTSPRPVSPNTRTDRIGPSALRGGSSLHSHEPPRSAHPMSTDPSKPTHAADNIVWSEAGLSREQRWKLIGLAEGRAGCTVWFTGLSGSGKSTIASALEAELLRHGRIAYRLDGDNIRHGLNADLGFSAEDRHENIRRIGEVARLFADCGVVCLVSFISPYRADRERVRRMHEAPEKGIQPLRFIEVFVDTPLEECERRDPKGLYKKARAGALKGFTGIDDPYESPQRPDLTLATASTPIAESVRRCMELLRAAPAPTLARE